MFFTLTFYNVNILFFIDYVNGKGKEPDARGKSEE